ncbi:peptide MFS transporter [Sphingomicrobium marinum]|uniref:peptide MFS transporter n=1 Tax=Sphingomicrobium marinum TaxID=1227950 RepID=UPI00223F10EC|nr:peptide MFS transporter [Sphingomicrobium marinum]
MANTDAVAPAGLPDGDSAGTILGHPKGLFVLFFAEMWERFSYYGMRALLIFYLTKHWLFSDGDSGLIYGAYTALVYITPVVGGYLADKYIGQRKAVLFGAVLLTLGHFFMAFEGEPGAGNADNPIIYVFWLALALIIVGSGFLKANISVMVGQLYPRTDVRRDGAYTIFYMGINLGAAIGSLLCGYIGETYGWAYGFGLAGIGMLAGLIVFIWGKPLLLGRGEPPKALAKGREISVYLMGLLLVAICWIAVQNQDEVGVFLGTFGAALVSYVLSIAIFQIPYKGYANAPAAAKYAFAALAALLTISMFFVSQGNESWQLPALMGAGGVLTVMVLQMVSKTDHDRDRIVAAMFLITVSIIFWALFEQAGSSLNLFTDRHVDRGGVPASTFQSINAIYIILLAPVFATLWTVMGRKGIEPSTPMKFGLGVVQVGLGFLVLVWGAESVGIDVPTPVIFIFLIYLLHTTGELCLSPVGLSAMNRLAPAQIASLIMGVWFFASATGNFAAGKIAQATGAEGVGEEAGKAVVLDVYETVGLVAMGVGVAVMVVSPLLKKLMHLDTLTDDGHLEGEAEVPAEPSAAGVHPTNKPA